MKIRCYGKIVDAVPLATYEKEEVEIKRKGIIFIRNVERIIRRKMLLVFIPWKYELKEIVEVPIEDAIDDVQDINEWIYAKQLISKPKLDLVFKMEFKAYEFHGYKFIIENDDFLINLSFDEHKSYELLYKEMPELLSYETEEHVNFDECAVNNRDLLNRDYYKINSLKFKQNCDHYKSKSKEKCSNCGLDIISVEGSSYISTDMNIFVCCNCFNRIKSISNSKCRKLELFETIDEIESTGYHEFVKGKTSGLINWRFNSLYLDDSYVSGEEVYDLLKSSIEDYDPYGVCYVNEIDWNKLKKKSDLGTEIVKKFIYELTDFADDAIKKYGGFTILGV